MDPRRGLANASESDARRIAALLGISYRPLPEGGYDHSLLITLLDGEGRVLARTSTPVGDSEFQARLQAATRVQSAPGASIRDKYRRGTVKRVIDESRRDLLKKLSLGVVLVPIAWASSKTALSADMPLVTVDDPTAKSLKYTSDASKAPDARPGSKCANCQLYQGAAGSAQGGCLLFPGKAVKASGWCSSWTAKTS